MPKVEQNLICGNCGKKFDGVRATHHDPALSWKLLCDACMKKIAESPRTWWLIERRKGKSMEQRLEWIEEWIYSHAHDKTLFDNIGSGGKK